MHAEKNVEKEGLLFLIQVNLLIWNYANHHLSNCYIFIFLINKIELVSSK